MLFLIAVTIIFFVWFLSCLGLQLLLLFIYQVVVFLEFVCKTCLTNNNGLEYISLLSIAVVALLIVGWLITS